MPSKSTMMTVAATLITLAIINNIPALGPVKKVVSGDSGWFG
jgi:hypothetical protein